MIINHYLYLTIIWYGYDSSKQTRFVFTLHCSFSFFSPSTQQSYEFDQRCHFGIEIEIFNFALEQMSESLWLSLFSGSLPYRP